MKHKSHSALLYILVIIGAVAGIVLGLAWPAAGVAMKPLSTVFIALIKMMIVPVIFCTIVTGVGSIAKAATVGKVGGLAFGYFMVMSTVALVLGLVVGNILKPGEGLDVHALIQGSSPQTAAVLGSAKESAPTDGTSPIVAFLLGIIPHSLLTPFTDGDVLAGLLIAVLVGFAIQGMGERGRPLLRGVEHVQVLVFRLLAMVMWTAPIGAFGGLAALLGAAGWEALLSLVVVMFGFYLTCAIFVFLVLGLFLYAVARINVFKLFAYLGKEFLLILATSSSESALPRVIAKLEHLGLDRSTVGISIPTGYSFNLDGTAIYLTMASLFIADAMGKPLSIGEQVGLLLFMIIASHGAAGVSGAGLATLAGGLQAARPDLLSGLGIVVGIDRFMSEARALTNFAGNSIAAVIVATWTRTVDRPQMVKVLAGGDPFDEAAFERGEIHAEREEARPAS